MTAPDAFDQSVARSLSEAQWQAHVEGLLGWCGYELLYHTFDSRRSRRGFPDIVALRMSDRPTVLVVIELKSEAGRVTPEQYAWLHGWRRLAEVVNGRCTGARIVTGVYRPSDRQRLLEELA